MTSGQEKELYRCPSCGGHSSVFFRMLGVPARVNFLYPTERSAVESARGDIVLGMCHSCGLVTNLAFDPSLLEYTEGYENPLHCSDVFRSYASDLAAELIRRFGLNGKTVVEIGCGDGDFLRLLCFRGNNRGVGFDPSYSGPADTNGRVRIVRDYYSESHADLGADFIYSRHTLEHVPNPKDLLSPVRRSIGERGSTPLFIEVPNAARILDECFIWDIIYEHTSYFTSGSLATTLEESGFGSIEVRDAFHGQFLNAFAHVSGEGNKERAKNVRQARERDERSVARFVAGYAATLEKWSDRLENLRRAARRTVIWGAGSKGITFLNSFDTRGVVEGVVDINPRKEGMFIAGTGHRILSPRSLAGIRPDTVLVVNPVYRDEVDDTLRALGLRPEIETL